jgi:hypothetical protein
VAVSGIEWRDGPFPARVPHAIVVLVIGSLTTEQMWQVSLLLANADKLPPDVNDALMEPLAQ